MENLFIVLLPTICDMSRYALVAYVLYGAYKLQTLGKLPEWLTSIRSIVTVVFSYTLCQLAMIGKLDTKDFLIVVQAVINFYFLVKQRELGNGNGNGNGNGVDPTRVPPITK